jgi:hypothetical protein
LDAVGHATDLVSGSLGVLTADANHLISDAGNQVSNVSTPTLDFLSGSPEALAKDTVADELSHDGNLATQVADPVLSVVPPPIEETEGLATNGFGQSVSLISHGGDTVAATAAPLSTDTGGLVQDGITQSGNLMLSNVASGLSGSGQTGGLGTLNTIPVDADQSPSEALQQSSFGTSGDLITSQSSIPTNPTSGAGELQQSGGTEATASAISSLDGTLETTASSPVSPQGATGLTALHQAGDVSSGVIPTSADTSATVSQADALFTNGQHTDYSIALQSNMPALSPTSSDTSAGQTDTATSATDVTSGDASTHQSSSTDTHSASTSTVQQNLDTSLLSSNTMDELGSRDHALI